MARVNPSKDFVMALRAHRATLDRLLDRRSAKQLQKFYDTVQAELAAKLRRAVRAGRKDTMTVLQMRQLLAQVKDGQKQIVKSLASNMAPISLEAQVEGIRQTAKTLATLEKKFTGATLVLPLEEAGTFMGLVDQRTPSLVRANAASFARYGADLTGKIEKALALSLASGETPDGAIDRIESVANTEWWRAERIVRTEMAYAFNTAHVDSVAEAAKDLPDLYNRWTEYINDATGQPLDDRVAPDSMVLHGQIALPGHSFVMPPDARVSAKLWGKTYMCGPNRPNDRSVMLPWRSHWGIPAWEWRDGRRVPFREPVSRAVPEIYDRPAASPVGSIFAPRRGPLSS